VSSFQQADAAEEARVKQLAAEVAAKEVEFKQMQADLTAKQVKDEADLEAKVTTV
jgi:hypothetical protein